MGGPTRLVLHAWSCTPGPARLVLHARSCTRGPARVVLHLRSCEESTDPADLAPYLAAFDAIDGSPDHLLVVVTDPAERIVATQQLTVLPGLARAGTTRLQIEAVRVSSQMRGNGLGSEMVAWAVEYGRARGCRLVQLTSDASRTDAHRFYERLGFASSHVGFKLAL